MEVKEAVKIAKEYINDLFDDEAIMDIGLEEVDLSMGLSDWKVTIGFFRSQKHQNLLLTALGAQNPKRSYKVVSINKYDGHVTSVTDRFLPSSE